MLQHAASRSSLGLEGLDRQVLKWTPTPQPLSNADSGPKTMDM